MLLFTVGRRPNISPLNLDDEDIKNTPRGNDINLLRMDWYQRIFIGLESTGQFFILPYLFFLPGWSGAYRFALVHIAQGSYPFFQYIFL